jgi:hypothetical protein
VCGQIPVVSPSDQREQWQKTQQKYNGFQQPRGHPQKFFRRSIPLYMLAT